MRKLAILLFAPVLAAADLSGIWTGQIPTRNGEFQDIAFKLSQTGATLSGKLYGDYGSTPVSEGKVEGDDVTFVVISSEQAGNQINLTRLLFKGKLKDGSLELTRERQSSTNAGNKGDVQFKGNTSQSFVVKRLVKTN